MAPATMAASAPMTTATLVIRLTALSESTFGARSSVVTRENPGNPVSVAPIESMKSGRSGTLQSNSDEAGPEGPALRDQLKPDTTRSEFERKDARSASPSVPNESAMESVANDQCAHLFGHEILRRRPRDIVLTDRVHFWDELRLRSGWHRPQ